MKKITLLLLAVFTLNALQVKADEGMWLPLLIKRLNYVDMQEHGLQLTAEEIYSVNHSSLKDAVVALDGRFCTGEIISDQGLMLTNHHCGYGSIQENSTPENNILTNGFWAKTKEDEIPVKFSVWFLERMDDVTERVLEGVKDGMNESERQAIISKNIAKIKEEEGTEFEIQIKSFYHGNEYYMFKYNIFRDVRLVGTPPESVGKFGGDTDNWMWPRHTGDFSMFRVYADKDNKPAAYSKDNVPYKPKHHLPVSLSGVQEGDYAMIMGYPGSTDRYLTSYGVEEAVNIEQPLRVKIRRLKLDIMEVGMDADPKVRLQYASKHAGVANYWKYFLGQSTQLVNNHVYDKKKKIEDEFLAWANADKDRKAKYGNALNLISEYYKASEKYVVPQTYFGEAIFSGPEIITLMLRNFGPRSDMKGLMDAGDQAKILEGAGKIKEKLTDFYKDFNLSIDQNTLAAMLELYYKEVDPEFHPETLKLIAKKYKGDFSKFAAAYYKKSPFASKEKADMFLDKFTKAALEKDLCYKMMNEFYTIYVEKIIIPGQTMQSKYEQGMRLFVDGLRKMNPDKVYASDANSTMRITYGNVLPYEGADAVRYHYLTTLEGVMEKEVKTDDRTHEFYVEPKLKELYEKKDYGRYALPNGKLPVAFLTNNDITGGNSGSPVINAKGELIGTAFDGNWEAMSGDIYFEPNLQRTISVDIRYTLFIIEKLGGAKHIVDEMTIVGGK
ncbi:MAG: S46 family peptidase [Flavobacteriales bacterium]|nr:S46 family peptidase [Flavobacteriales bacterium]